MTKKKKIGRSLCRWAFIHWCPARLESFSSVTLLALGGKGERESDWKIEASIACCSTFGVHCMASSLVYYSSCWMAGELEYVAVWFLQGEEEEERLIFSLCFLHDLQA